MRILIFDIDTCRICSAPAEPDAPLFHPCKCSGTIKYIHQDCLTTWLAHSKKKSCDVCKYQYSFTKVYAQDMPETIPVYLLLRRVVRQIFFAIQIMLRATLVGFVWLVVLPYGTVVSWRLYFFTGDRIAWWISNHKRPASSIIPFPSSNATLQDVLLTIQANNGNVTWQAFSPFLRTMSSDVFTGQIIASVIVLSFLAVFLLREYIAQNARPGVFEDVDLPEAPVAPPPRIIFPLPTLPIFHHLFLTLRPPSTPIVSQDSGPSSLPMISLSSYDELQGDAPADPEVVPRTIRETTYPDLFSSSASQSSVIIDDLNNGLQPLPSEPDVRYRREIRRGKRSAGFESVPLHKRSDSLPSNFTPQPLQTFPTARPLSPPKFGVTSTPASREFQYQYDGKTPQPTYSDAFNTSPLGNPRPFSPGVQNGDDDATSIFQTSSSSTAHIPSTSPFSTATPPSVLGLDLLNANVSSRASEPFDVSNSPFGSAIPSSSNSPDVFPFSFTVPSSAPSTSTAAPRLDPKELPEPFSVQHYAKTSQIQRPPLPTSPAALPDEQPLTTPSAVMYMAPEDMKNVALPPSDYFQQSSSSSAGAAPYQTIKLTPSTTSLPDEVPSVTPSDYEPSEAAETNAELDEEDRLNDLRDAEGHMHEVERLDIMPALGDVSDDDEEEDGGGHRAAIDVRLVQGPQNFAAAEAFPQEAVADQEQNVDIELEEDMDGALEGTCPPYVTENMLMFTEAVGMRGPIYTVFQHAALMIFILDVSIGVGVWIPFTLGKTAAFLVLEPRRALELIHAPLKIVRIVTDPIVDTVVALIKPSGSYAWNALLRFLPILGLSQVEHTIREWASREATGGEALDGATKLYVQASQRLLTLAQLLSRTSTFRGFSESCLSWSQRALATYLKFAHGDTTTDRVLFILLGDSLAGVLVAFYLNILTVGNIQNAGRAVRTVVKQQLMVMKVAVFILIELFLFPLGCGIILDLSTLGLFGKETLSSRISFFHHAPISSVLYHWLFGTIYMYIFSTVLSACRSIMRPGAMWFIKDPQDPTFQPIRDILDRRAMMQLKKLGFSALMYAVFIGVGFWTMTYTLSLISFGSYSFLPLRVNARRPLSDIPVDLLFMHLVLPAAIHRAKPRRIALRCLVYWWRLLSRVFRLTSYMFGGRYPAEETAVTMWDEFISQVTGKPVPSEKSTAFAGGFRRVPAKDTLALVKDQPTLVVTDATGQPVDEANRKRMELQDLEATNAKRNIRKDYMVIYAPDRFRERLIAFVIAVSISGVQASVLMLAIPISFGRQVFKLFMTEEVHDGYSFVLGGYLLWSCFYVAQCIDRSLKRRDRHRASDEAPRANHALYIFKRGALWALKVTYMFFWICFVIPILVALGVELYAVLPVRLWLNPNHNPTFRIWDLWAFGLIFMKVLVKMRRNTGGHPVISQQHIDYIRLRGWTKPNPETATRMVIAPVVFGLVGMIAFPPAVMWIASVSFKWLTGLRLLAPFDDKFLFVYIYPVLFATAALERSVMNCRQTVASWAQIIRDSEFLVELRVRNLE
ncbi:hypothetical protein SISNIDRAFT_410077 [Sistotremastrum niveocremeum HHB9708]|uniref:RING-type E3 ubiquitin transferase n=1 Tax=Sistotremastrum niveocremeum HHB9708 TaxID=1314777 RepID=A0A164W0A2_9AGAM|nr:hypothetical protein SISNIDRAFT_410077 [Sistotremastrum niveocremeum HHB9708]